MKTPNSKHKFSMPPLETDILLDMYENGEITKKQYKEAMDKYWDDLLADNNSELAQRLRAERMENKHKKIKAKELLSKILISLLIMLLIALIIFATGIQFYEIFKYCARFVKIVGNGSWVIGVILLPLSIYGAIQIFKGFCSLCDQEINSIWNCILTIASIIALFFAVSRF